MTSAIKPIVLHLDSLRCGGHVTTDVARNLVVWLVSMLNGRTTFNRKTGLDTEEILSEVALDLSNVVHVHRVRLLKLHTKDCVQHTPPNSIQCRCQSLQSKIITLTAVYSHSLTWSTLYTMLRRRFISYQIGP